MRLFWVVAACMCAVHAAHGDPLNEPPNPEAEQLFRDGRALLKDGKLSEACDRFAASAALDASVGTFLNLGDCRAKLAQTASAWAAFVEAGRLAGKLGDERKAEADKRAAELEPALSYITIVAPSTIAGLVIARDGKPLAAAAWGQPIAIDPGGHAISATAPGFAPWRTSIAVKPDGDRERVVVPALIPLPAPVVSRRPEPQPRSGLRTAALVLGGAGVASAGTGLGLLIDATILMNDARQTCPSGTPCHDAHAVSLSDRATTRASVATAAGAIGAAAIAAGIVLWFVGRPRNAEVVPGLDRRSASLSLAVRF